MKIYVYLSNNTKESLKDTQRKYHISISTIGQILTDIVKPLMKNYDGDFFTKYLDQEHRTKTTIKPNNTKEKQKEFIDYLEKVILYGNLDGKENYKL